MTQASIKFQQLLRVLFQFDCSDLDFGIYRIMNYKRDVIERFIATNLPNVITEELKRGAMSEQAQAKTELDRTADEIRGKLDEDALDAAGKLVMHQDTQLGKKYLDLQAKAEGAQTNEALEATIYNHLYTFFRRCYQDGDFISKRRYSKRQKYAIPYNGEEVYLYWANHDQYYVKSAEYFHDYSFKAHDVTVHFKLTAANVEQNNVKGDKRFFLPCIEKITCDEEALQLDIPFEYRPLTDQETKIYGTKNQQDKIIAEAVKKIPGKLSLKSHKKVLFAITDEKRKNSSNEPVSVLEHHVRQYARKNTSDFFIHKDLKGFLSRELDFYLKNEVLNLDELESAGENRTDGWFQMMKAIKAVGDQIIDFLHQIESFQKMLWEKRKFVTETHYCITVGSIDESFYPEIAACEAQWEEWQKLFHIEEHITDLIAGDKNSIERLAAIIEFYPTLVLDTKYFDRDFVDGLLDSVDDLDGKIDGLLIHSENWQALNLLSEKYQSKIFCTYIDPPYNTGNDEFVYKDNYQHSCWLSMISQTVRLNRGLMCTASSFFASCDDNENSRFKQLLDLLFGINNFESQIIIQSNKRGQTYKSIAKTHEYLLVYNNDVDTRLNGLPREIESGESDEWGLFEYWELRNRNPKFGRFNRPNLYFPIYASQKQFQDIGFSYISVEKTKDINVAIFPKNSAGADSCWRWSSNKVREASNHNAKILIAKQTRNGEWRVFEKARKTLKAPKSIWFDINLINEKGTKEVGNMGFKNFGFPKPVGLIELIVQIGSSETDTTLDYFAGSGTTGHAIINLNREDGGNRKFILVEMGEYFETVLLPRIKKVTFAPEWKDGKSKRMATAEEAERSPRIVKYLRVESYEDTLNNITFEDASGQVAYEFEDYLLKYMLKWETRKSETLLKVEKLTKPFSYKLMIQSNGEIREQPVDIAETFNYLLGLRVSTRKVYENDGSRYLVYRGNIDQQQVVVIWRETEGWEKEDLVRDKQFVIDKQLTEGADEIYVNGDSLIPDAKPLDTVFKDRMFAPMEV